jgi:hypothetical protein
MTSTPLDKLIIRCWPGEDGKTGTTPTSMLAIPYYAWCNRAPNEMNVWIARTAEKAQPVPATANGK